MPKARIHPTDPREQLQVARPSEPLVPVHLLVTPESIALAKAAQRVMRAKVARELINQGAIDVVQALGFDVPAVTAEQWHNVDGVEALSLLIEQFGARRVHAWLSSLCAIDGVDLPCTRKQ